ncbi:sugar ABC transporter substrate-binding protein [Lentzea nigeriaca]|uniref:sugar ABC transporter substrate-binding protein n=1 Tax=Lentzea nigeriaca TaxID=1128665 RepID=UPI0019574A3A|nr:extracellular solute-binding protein [Lentzea nigeriaca]
MTLSACGSGFDSASGADTPGDLTVLIGASGDAETNAVKSAVAAWSAQSGTKAEVVVASDLSQQLSQGFTSGRPADLFYLSGETMPGFAANGALEPVGERLANVGDFHDAIKASFTYKGKLYAAPKDFSTLGLVINRDAWAAAGLTDADIPTTWDQLAAVARKLTTPGRVGLSMSPEFARLGVFLAQAGGWLVAPDGKAVADSPENLRALEFVKGMLADGSLKFSSALGAGWGGEAFGKGLAAMTIEGNWVVGALKNDFPAISYRVAELPAGPGGRGTMQFNGGWGVAADSKNKDAAVKLVEYLTNTDRQLAFADAFGVMPSVKSAAQQWKTKFPQQAAFLAGGDYAKNIPNLVGISDVIKDFNSQIEGLVTRDPKAVLGSVQRNLQPLVGK